MRRRDKQQTIIMIVLVVLAIFVLQGWMWGTVAVLAVLAGVKLADYMNERDRR